MIFNIWEEKVINFILMISKERRGKKIIHNNAVASVNY